MRALILILSVLIALPALAVEPDEILDDPALEARARELSKGLRCPVCRNESIDESNAGVSKDLRLLVRERLVAGDTDREAIDYIVDRYGEYVLLTPRASGSSWVLYLFAPALLIAGGVGGVLYVRGRAKPASAEAGNALDPEEEARLKEILGK